MMYLTTDSDNELRTILHNELPGSPAVNTISINIKMIFELSKTSYIQKKFMKKLLLYLLRWQASTLILSVVTYFW